MFARNRSYAQILLVLFALGQLSVAVHAAAFGVDAHTHGGVVCPHGVTNDSDTALPVPVMARAFVLLFSEPAPRFISATPAGLPTLTPPSTGPPATS